MTTEWLLIGISVFLLLGNMILILMLTITKKRKRRETSEVYESMSRFVAQLENENDELYDKLIAYIKNSETQLSDRLDRLEKSNTPEFQEVEIPHETSMEIDKIMQLSKQGFSSRQIAKVLQIDYGKVELVIHMNNMRRDNFMENGVL
ncbi:hypothetical protein Plano_0146 [Planococcus sp. PAMC 21323]|uniref:DUF6115 domain-containing protein n=1 Tax=Planococcus sp. PAMC 21323 TaxID=1526927 RepID=UPI000571F3F9|nr:hypothetical protein [Planococcus sp. PAMC 21323]AIY04111.1 hypothetical protein Plano_0146 [Planococcus sp. PAMC 21323]